MLVSLIDVLSFAGFCDLLSTEDMVDLVIFIVSDDDDDFIEDVNVDVVIEEDLVSPSKSQNCSTADDLGDSETLYPFDRDVDSVL